MSSLIPEKAIVISPSLAATIGLEEAILLQVLNDIAQLTAAEPGQNWFALAPATLRQQCPFWQQGDLERILRNLRDKGVILLEGSWQTQRSLRFAMNEGQTGREAQPRAATRPAAPPRQQPPGGANLLASDWRPEEDLLQLLALNHGIPREFSLQQLEDFIMYWRDRQQVSHSWPSKFRQHVLKEWRFQQSRDAASQKQAAEQQHLDQRWQPSQDALEILYRAGVNKEFIEDAVPEFVLYWSERGEASNTWNSKFIAHIRRQWARFTASLSHDYEPRPIPENWHPSEDVYDILRLANIDIDFARELIPEFVLFWRDTQQIQRSWNTKFLQHVKYQWATRHHFSDSSTAQQRGQHVGQSGSRAGTHPANTSELRNQPFKQLTDRSWAAGIVEGL